MNSYARLKDIRVGKLFLCLHGRVKKVSIVANGMVQWTLVGFANKEVKNRYMINRGCVSMVNGTCTLQSFCSHVIREVKENEYERIG